MAIIIVAACVLVVGGIFLTAMWIDDRLADRASDRRIMDRYHVWRAQDAFSRRVSMNNKRRGTERILGRGPR